MLINEKYFNYTSVVSYLTNDSQVIFNDFRDCLKLTVCPDVKNSCQLGECQSCSGIIKIKKTLMQSFDEENLEEVKFDSWQQTVTDALSRL